MRQICCEERNKTDVEPELILLASVGNEQIQGLMELARYMHIMDIVDTDILKWIKIKILYYLNKWKIESSLPFEMAGLWNVQSVQFLTGRFWIVLRLKVFDFGCFISNLK